MKTLKMFLIAMVLALAATPSLHAQTVTPRTTLTNAIAVGNPGTITITIGSETGMSVSTASAQTFFLIDAELMQVVSFPTTTTATVRRGTGIQSGHAAGAEVRWGPGGFSWIPSTGNTSGVFGGSNAVVPTGSCTRANNQYLPVFITNPVGVVHAYDCPNNVSTTTGQWIQWQYWPNTSTDASRTPLAFAGTAVAKTYTALPSDYYIAITSAISGTAQTQIQITLPCSSVPPGKIWIVGDEGGGAGTSSSNIEIRGALLDSQVISTGYTAKAYRSNGTSCYRLF